MSPTSRENRSSKSGGTAAMLGLHDVGSWQKFLRRRKNYIDYMAGLLVLLNSCLVSGCTVPWKVIDAENLKNLHLVSLLQCWLRFVMMLELEIEGRAVGTAEFGRLDTTGQCVIIVILLCSVFVVAKSPEP